jgi:hypothetical protein
VEEVKQAEEGEDEYSAVAESCLARKLASFGMTARAYYTLWRTQGEDKNTYRPISVKAFAGKPADSAGTAFLPETLAC